MTSIQIFTVGGTIDKIYFDANSEFQVGEPQIGRLLQEAGVGFDYSVHSLMRKDSLDMTDEDRAAIRDAVVASGAGRILITHGTDTMIETAMGLLGMEGKVIVLTGSIQPATLRVSDAIFNIGFAVATLLSKPAGVYVAMNGKAFDPAHVRKNLDLRRFEED